jgi:acyl-homoserine-lactone acylase
MAITAGTKARSTNDPGANTTRLPMFDDDELSIPIAAVQPEDGAPFTLFALPGKQQRRRYGIHGDTYVSVVEFGVTAQAGSIMTFGESADPKSNHFFDQAPLFANGEFKPSWMTLKEIKQHSEAVYHPGEETTH